MMFQKRQTKEITFTKIWLLILSVLALTQTRRIEVPPIIYPDNIEVRLKQLLSLRLPSNDFKNVYQRSAKRIQDKKLYDFPQCVSSSPQINFPTNYSYHIKYKTNRPRVIDNIEDIIYGNSLIDIFQKDKNLYVMTTSGYLLHFGLDPSIQNILTQEKIKSGQNKLQHGNFFINNLSICFANGQHIFSLDEQKKSLIKLQNYNPVNINSTDDQFQLVIAFNDRYFATLFSQTGIIIYQRDQTNLNKIHEVFRLNKQSFRNADFLELNDFEFDQVRNLLFVADKQAGIFCFSVNATSTSINITLLSNTINVDNCEVIYLHKDQLYMSCKGLVRVDISKWPIVTIEKVFGSHVNIKEMVEGENILIAAGSNIMQVFYNNYLIQYVEDHGLDKLLLIGDKYISANEGIIIFGKYQIVPGTLLCQFKSNDMVGLHSLVLTTQAQCDQIFIRKVNPTWTPNYTPQDTCLYTTYVTLQVWKPGKLSIMLLSFSIAIVVIIVWSLIVWWCVNKFKLQILNNELRIYSNIAQNSSARNNSQPHEQLVQEAQEGTLNHEKPKDNKIQSFQIKNDLHAIQ